MLVLGAELEKEFDIQVMHSSGVDDFDIVKSTCNIASSKTVIVVGDYTDHGLLLHHYVQHEHNDVYMQSITKLIKQVLP